MDESYIVPEGTLPLLGGILTMMDFAHRDMTQIIADLPDEALIWQPASDMGSLAIIICHTMYVEAVAIRIAAGENVSYDPEADDAMWEASRRISESEGERLSYSAETNDAMWGLAVRREELIARIAAGDAIMKRILPIMTVAGMEKRFHAFSEVSTQGSGYLIAKAATHTTMHWGHMQMTRQLWEQAHPEFVGSYTRW